MPAESIELFKVVAPLGVGGVLAGVIFWFYHREFVRKVGTEREDRQQLIGVVAQNARVGETMAHAIRGLTAAVEKANDARERELGILLEAIGRRRGEE